MESSTPVQATVTVSSVPDAPVIFQPQALAFADKVDYNTGSYPDSVTSADVNGDGMADLIVANSSSNNVSVLMNNGYGSSFDRMDYVTGGSPQSVTTADVNSDGNADLIVANWGSNSVSVLLNSGSGTFDGKVDYAVGSYPHSVTTADVNGDGKADLIVENWNSSSVSVLINNGNGTFADKVDYSTDSNPHSITMADVNGDGKADLIVANHYSSSISVLANNGDGTFAAGVDYATGSGPASVTSADVNGDGKADLIVVNYYSQSVSVLANNGDGTFAARVDYVTGYNPRSVTTDDVNGDGKADLIVANYGSNTVSVLTNNGDGTFAAKVDYAAGSTPWSVTSADLNGDGKADLIVANANSNTVSVLTNTTHPAVTSFFEKTPVHISSDIIINDPDGDSSWNGGSLNVQITANSEAADSLTIADANPGGSGIWLDTAGNKLMAGSTEIGSADAASVSNGDAWHFSFNVNATNALVQDVARALIFNNSSETPVGGGRSISFTVTDNDGASASLVEKVVITTVNAPPTGVVIISGEAVQGHELTVSNSLADVDGLGLITYTWQADGTTVGAGESFTLGQSEVGKAITVLASYTDLFYHAESVSSTPTPLVANVNDEPTGVVTISGEAIQGHQLTVSNTLADADGLGPISYTWQADGTTVGSGESFILGQSETGKVITVLASYTDHFSHAESVSSEPTVPVVDVNDAPTLSAFSGSFGTIPEDTGVAAVTFADLQAQGNAADIDGTVESFVVKSVSNGTLRIGSDAETATPYNGWTNNTIDATHHAFWSPAANLNGALNAFAVVARDNSGLESFIPVQAAVTVTPADDAPVIFQPYPAVTSFIEMAPVHISSDIIINDPDGDASWNGGALNVQITANAEAADSLSLVTGNPGGNGIWLDTAGNKLMAGTAEIGSADAAFVSNGDAWHFSFNASATNALVQDVARALIFNNSSYTPGTAERNITFTVTDNTLASASVVERVTVTAVDFVPTLTTFNGAFGTTPEDTGEVNVTFANLLDQGNEADVDGSVDAFVVKSASGTLRIGADAASATAWDALTNNTIDATHQAFWTPATDANGTLNAFAVVARDNNGGESLTPVHVTVDVTPVNDSPRLAVGSDCSAWEGSTFNHQIILGDPDPDAHHITVDWGDGSEETVFDTPDHYLNISHNYADNGLYTVAVTADDQQSQVNSFDSGSFEVTVHNVAPVAPVTGVDRLNTGSSYTLHVGAVVDPGPDTRTGYSINWGDGTTSAFTSDEWATAAGTFTHTCTASSPAETGRTITVNTTDEDGTFVLGSKYVTINRPPSDIYLDNARIAENSQPGTAVGTLYSSDDEGWWNHEYHLLDDAGGRFVLDGDQIHVAEGAVLDFETATSYTIRVSSTDPGGLSFEHEIAINLADVGPDLLVTQVQTPPGVVDVDAGSSIEVSWTITTQGTEPSHATWTDQIYLDSPDTSWLDRWVGSFTTTAQLPLSGGLERIQTIQVPFDMQGHFNVVVLTDANNNVAEGSSGESNNSASGAVTFNVLNTNLEVESVTAPSSGFAGREIEVQWVVNNTGNASTPVRYWYDQIYLSDDTILDGNDLLLGTVQNQSYLDVAEGYTSTARVTLPSSREGSYHILVKTDAYQQIPEGGHEGDNVTASGVIDIQPIPLSELSDLAVISVGAPDQAFSGQNMSITYKIDNVGLAPISGNSTVWVERIYMSTDDVLDAGDRLLSTVWRDLPVDKLPLPESQSHFINTQKVMLPVGVEGDFYFFVSVTPVAPVSNVFQSNDKACDSTPTVVHLTPPPDLEALDISAPVSATAGHDLTFTWHVANSGATTTPNSGWYDKFYLSTDKFIDAGDTVLAEVWHSGALEPDSNYGNSVSVRLADGLEGSWYLIAATDSRNYVFEYDNATNANNVVASVTPIAITSRPADLVVTEVVAPAAAQAGTSLRVSWTVTNQGVGYSSVEQWTDSVILSGDAVLGNGDDIWIGSFTHSGSLQAGNHYSQSELVSLPGYLSGQYQLFVKTDVYDQVYESVQNNNDAHSGIQIQAQPTADLQVSSVIAPPTVGSGDLLTVTYTVVNEGLGRTNAEWWVDTVVLSKDDIPGNADDVYLGTLYHSNRLAPAESYEGTGSFRLPIDLQGDYKVFVQTDIWNGVTELNGENNNVGVSDGTTTINLTSTPDLVMSILQAADEGTSGQNLHVDWTVHNNGAATSGGWRQAFYLSRDGVLDRGADIFLGYAESGTSLASHGDAVFSQTFQIPYGISGKYTVFGVVDSSDAIYERGGEGNNMTQDATPVQITQQPPVDLVAGVITLPENGVPGAQASISYTVTNESLEAVSGQWRDSIYISKDALWDVGDALFSRVYLSGPLAGGDSYTQTATGTLPGVVGGDYYMIVRSDIYNQIPETNEANNLKASLGTTHLDVEALTLGTPDTASFTPGGAVYYRVDVAAGETLQFNFDRAATDGRTELFVSYGTMPSRSVFEYRYNQADSPDQNMVITNSKAGTYYVMAYNAAGATDAYSITANTLQFSITELGTTAGSNKGQVTVRIDGAELTTHTTAVLVGPDGVEHEASEIYWKDDAEVWATFDLRGMAVDTYDVKITDGARTAVLNDGFTVNNGDLGHIEYGMENPSAIRVGQIGSIRVYYENLGETDVVAPLLSLTSNALLKLPGEAGFGGTTLQLLGINGEGPAGILQPGAQGSFQLFFKPVFAGVGTVTFGVSSLTPDKVIDWNAILDASKPDGISDESWAVVKANLIAELGSTTTDYQHNLAGNATALDQLEGRTNDVAELLSLDYLNATDSGALLHPASLGVLGYSHTFAWDITATRQSDGSVIVEIAGAQEHFERQSDGSYKLVGQGTSTLTETSGAFEVHQQDGTRITFNLDGTFAELLDGNGQGVQATYDAAHLTNVVSSNGHSQSFVYNEAGRLIQQTDQAGHSTTFTYDADNQHLTSVTTVDGTTEYSYVTESGAAQHRLSSVTLPGGTVEHFDYDSNGRLMHQILNDGAESISYSYVGVNEVIATDATGAATRMWLNESGKIAQVEDALGHVSQLRYDANGNMTGIVHADGTSTGIEYDSAGNPLSVQDALGHTVDFGWDAQFGHLAQVSDQRGNAIGYGYDSQGNLNTITYADSSSESYSYNVDGYLQAAVSRSGESVSYTFNGVGHLTEKSYADGSKATFAYDAHGNLISAVDADSHTTFEYDSADRLIKTTDGDGRWLSYAYDAAGHRTQMADQAGHITNYSYNDRGHLASLTDGDGHLIASYSYDAAGHLSRGENGNGTYTTYEYDAAGQLTHLVNHQADATVNSSFEYTYDAAGHRTSETTLEGTTSYEYDAIGQLTGATLQDGNHIAYNYDAAGNRTSVVDDGVTTNYTANNLNEYTGVGSATYAYDADGNLTDKTESGVTSHYAYDVENHLVSVTTLTESWSYEYDALGNRIASVHDGVRTEYQLDPTGMVNVAGEYDSNGDLVANYTYGIGLEGQTLSGGSSYYYDYNAIGSTTGLSGSIGAYVNQYSYLPFGENLTATETVANSFEYVGQWGVTDEGNGLDFMRARFYDAGDGRFVSTDPIGTNGGVNLYAYSLNSPLNYVDPSGLDCTADTNEGWVNNLLDLKKFGTVFSIAKNPIGATANGIDQVVSHTIGGESYNQSLAHNYFVPIVAGGAAVAGAVVLAGSLPVTAIPILLGFIGGFEAVGGAITILGGMAGAFTVGYKTVGLIDCVLDVPELDVNRPIIDITISVVRPSDPNDIVGPQSFGADHWTSSSNALPYTIHYENQASATAPAQQVTITQTLDSDLNTNSFRLGDFGWGDIYVDVQDGTSFYIDRIDLTETRGYMVDVMAGVDVAKHEVFWSFTTIDPNTGEIPVDPTIGFLPPDSDGSIGQGFVNYTVRANAGATTGTVIDAKATIVFTTQEPIDTPAIFNTLDTAAPESHIEAVTETTVESAQFLVRWSGSDVGSAIAGYSVYVSDNGGAYSPWLENTTLTEATYAGQAGHTYAFYTVATDNAGNSEGIVGQADLTIQVTLDALPSDTVPPEIAGVILPSDGLYAAGQSLDFAVQFSETVFVDVAGHAPVIKLTVGATEVDAVYESGSGTDTLIFSHVVADGEYDANGIALGNTIVLNGATLRDTAGNPVVDLTLAAGATEGILVDNAPTLHTALVDQTGVQDHAFSFQLSTDTFADVDAGDSLSYTATLDNGDPLSAWLHFDADTLTFSGTPLDGDVGSISVKVTATDSSSATASDIFDLQVSAIHDLHGDVTFWNGGAVITDVTSTLSSVPAATGTQSVEFRNIQVGADGVRTIEIWETSAQGINSVQLELLLSDGSVASWQDASGLPSGWSSLTNTGISGKFMLGGMGTTALSDGPVKLGTLTLTEPTDAQHFDLIMSKGQLGNEAVPVFGIALDCMTTGFDGSYQHINLLDGSYALSSAKVAGESENSAVMANDALAALKIAVGMNPNADGSDVLSYQFLAADVNHDGKVKATDALNILKMAVDLETAPANEWIFVPDSVGSESMTRTHVVWQDSVLPVTLDMDQELHLIGIVKGDVDGSWLASGSL